MTCGFWSSPAIAMTGSPGSSFCRPKIIIDTRLSVGIAMSARLAMIRNMIRSALDADAAQTDQAIRVGREALDFLRQHIRPRLRVDVDDRVFVGEDLRGGVVERLAFGGRGLDARLVQQTVHLAVAVMPVVQIALARVELVQIAARIHAAR